MANNQLSYFLVLLLPIVCTKIIMGRAFHRLAPEKKSELLAAVKGVNNIRYTTLFLLVMSVLFLPQSSVLLLPLFVSSMSWLYWRKMKTIELPAQYIQAFSLSVVLATAGVGLLLFFSGSRG
jgi:hypothetical protein